MRFPITAEVPAIASPHVREQEDARSGVQIERAVIVEASGKPIAQVALDADVNGARTGTWVARAKASA